MQFFFISLSKNNPGIFKSNTFHKTKTEKYRLKKIKVRFETGEFAACYST